MLRNVNLLRLFGNAFIILILAYGVLVYYVFGVQYGTRAPDQSLPFKIHLGFFNAFGILFLISFFQTIISDPGKVPLFWGFFLDDPDHKRRRYCLICHIFKPERCHHCSACNRCVLNMDHHCPWLNNCIGFYNRKFFLLLLTYAILAKFDITIVYFMDWFNLARELLSSSDAVYPWNSAYLMMICYPLNCVMFVVLITFFKFHIQLIIDNMTTIEYMDKKRGPEARHEAINYDMGFYYNFIQIFGKNPWLWAFPIFLRSGGPVGDGVVWPQKPSRGQTYEMEMSNRDLSLNRDTPTENNTLGTKGEASNPGSRNEVFNPAFPEQNSMS